MDPVYHAPEIGPPLAFEHGFDTWVLRQQLTDSLTIVRAKGYSKMKVRLCSLTPPERHSMRFRSLIFIMSLPAAIAACADGTAGPDTGFRPSTALTTLTENQTYPTVDTGLVSNSVIAIEFDSLHNAIIRQNGYKIQKMTHSGNNMVLTHYINSGQTVSRIDTALNWNQQLGFLPDQQATPCWLLALQIAAYAAVLPEACVNPLTCAVTGLALIDKIKQYNNQGCYIFDPTAPMAGLNPNSAIVRVVLARTGWGCRQSLMEFSPPRGA